VRECTIILNPIAGKGYGARLASRVETEFQRRGCDYTLVRTEHPGHATELAKAATTQLIVALGGDGTVNEVANGMTEADKILGVLPAGSGNDFIKSINVSKRLSDAFDVLFRGKLLRIDVGSVATAKDDSATVHTGEGVRKFINGVGIGFDAAVAAKIPEIKYLTGVPLYLAAVLRTLGRFKAPHFKMRLDGTQRESTNLLIAVGNGQCAGGGFYLTPDAMVDDGKLDVCLVDAVSIPTILRLMPLVMLGKHRKARQVTFMRAKELHFSAPSSFYVHADGEIVGRDVFSVAIRLDEGALRVIAG
jgi:YegS/Rv2252/BmrU family lipid kinase